MKKSVKEDIFVKQPIYEGGTKAMHAFIQQNLLYPSDALSQKIEGVVELRITINHEGFVSDAIVLGTLYPSCDTEANRICRLMRFTIPKNPRKLKVLFHKIIKVQFQLPKIQKQQITKQQSPPQITYSYAISAPQNANPTPPASKTTSYSYTIKTSK